jgi:site-specific DNA-methyltransferase (adenine-specific)
MKDYLNKVICGDCLEVMKGMADKSVDLVLTDPPFGLGNFVQQTGNKRGEKVNWNETTPSKEYFDEMVRISKNQIIWGANFFNCFPPKGGAIVWKKFQTMPDFSKCDIASSTFYTKTELVEIPWSGGSAKKSTKHPCERPVDLYRWCLNQYTKEGEIIFDPFLGSGSVAVACVMDKRNYIGCEISKEYCDIANARLSQDLLF